MKLSKEHKIDWLKGKEVNSGEYGSEIYRYAEAWADLIEIEMEKGKKLEDIATECGHKADTSGITGFMYGAAVEVLSHCWEYGDQLRRWHNIETQIKDEV